MKVLLASVLLGTVAFAFALPVPEDFAPLAHEFVGAVPVPGEYVEPLAHELVGAMPIPGVYVEPPPHDFVGALPVPDNFTPPPYEIVGEYVVSPDKPLIVTVDAEDPEVHILEGDDDDDDDDDDDEDEGSDDSEDDDDIDSEEGSALTVFCLTYPKALECQGIIVLNPLTVDLAAPPLAVLPPVDLEEILSVLPELAVPVETLFEPEVSPLAEVLVQEVLSTIPVEVSNLRVKRQARRGNRPTQVLTVNGNGYDDMLENDPIFVYCAANPAETGCQQRLGISTVKKTKKKKKDSSESGSSSSEESETEDTEDILVTIRRRCTLNPSLPGCRRKDRPVSTSDFVVGGQQNQFASPLQGFTPQSAGTVQNGQVGVNQGFQQGLQAQSFAGNVQNGQAGVNQGFQQGLQSQAFAAQSLGNSQNVQSGSASQAAFSSQGAQQVGGLTGLGR